jgi:hypothetical protein
MSDTKTSSLLQKERGNHARINPITQAKQQLVTSYQLSVSLCWFRAFSVFRGSIASSSQKNQSEISEISGKKIHQPKT